MNVGIQDRYPSTSIRNSTCDAVPHGSVLGSTRPLKLEPNHDVARLCGRSLVGRHRSTETPIDSTHSPSDSSRFALVFPCASRSPSFVAYRLQGRPICLPSFFHVTIRYVTLTFRYVTPNEVFTLRYVTLR